MPAEGAYVLSPTDVRNIRSYVQRKYAAVPQEKRAEIIADAVTRIIHKQLPDFELDLKKQLTAALIKTAVLEEQRPVRADDIYKLSLSLDQTDPTIAEPLNAWLRKQESQLYGIAPKQQLAHAAAVPASAEVIELPLQNTPFIRRKRLARLYMYGALCISLIAVTIFYGRSLSEPLQAPAPPLLISEPIGLELTQAAEADGLPPELRYVTINTERLVAYLNTKSSLLAEQPYFDAIMETSKSFDIHPVLLFAITGQEQGFVPKTHELAEQIANNPFNVFHSWKDFNTNIRESTEIASRTIVRLSKDKPDDVDAYTWINREYAEDPNWSNGVRTIFATIMRYVETPLD